MTVAMSLNPTRRWTPWEVFHSDARGDQPSPEGFYWRAFDYAGRVVAVSGPFGSFESATRNARGASIHVTHNCPECRDTATILTTPEDAARDLWRRCPRCLCPEEFETYTTELDDTNEED